MANLHGRTNRRMIFLLTILFVWQAVDPSTLCASCRFLANNVNVRAACSSPQLPTEEMDNDDGEQPYSSLPSPLTPLTCHCFNAYVTNGYQLFQLASEDRSIEKVIPQGFASTLFPSMCETDISNQALKPYQASESSCIMLCRFHL